MLKFPTKFRSIQWVPRTKTLGFRNIPTTRRPLQRIKFDVIVLDSVAQRREKEVIWRTKNGAKLREDRTGKI